MGRLVGLGFAANIPCIVFIATPVNSYTTATSATPTNTMLIFINVTREAELAQCNENTITFLPCLTV